MAKETEAKNLGQEMSKEERLGFHKGSLTTLTKEREELVRILTIVAQLMQMHVKELKDLGVALEKMAKDKKQELAKKKPIEELLGKK